MLLMFIIRLIVIFITQAAADKCLYVEVKLQYVHFTIFANTLSSDYQQLLCSCRPN